MEMGNEYSVPGFLADRRDSTTQIDPMFIDPTAARSARRVQLALRLNW